MPRLLASLAFQLAKNVPALRPLYAGLEPRQAFRSADEAFEALLLQPLSQAEDEGTLPARLVGGRCTLSCTILSPAARLCNIDD